MSPPQPIALHPMGNRPNHLQLSLSDQHRVQLRLLDQANGPAGGAEIMWISKRDGLRDPDGFTPIAATDSAGRVAMRVQAGPWVVFARTSSAMALETVAVNSDTELQVQLHPMPAMRGRVVDGAGQPVPGAILQLRRSRWSGGPGRDDDLVHIASNLNWQWIGNTRSTADGSFECCFIEVPNASYEGVFTANGKQSAPITIASGEQPTTVVIE